MAHPPQNHHHLNLKLPSYHEARVTYLKKEVDRVEEGLEKYKEEWKKTGCTIMSDGWTDGKQRSLTNFLVNSPSGTVFVRSIDTSSFAKDAKKLFEMLDGLVEEIGEKSVVQVITDSVSAYVLAGSMLENKRPNLFWSPCAAHLIDLILQDIGDGKVFKDTIEKAKKVTVYIYRHCVLLSMFRRFSDDKELTRPRVTRFATTFLTLKRFKELKIPLRELFASKDWAESSFASTSDGKQVENIILGDARFWQANKYCLKCVTPIYKLLRLVDGDVKPAMGYIYEAIERAKEQIKDNFNGVETRYKPNWEKIDRRWNLQIHRPLHAAGYFLNPSLHFETNFKADLEVKTGLFDVIERMYNRPTMMKIHEQIEKFKESSGMFGKSASMGMRKKMQPAKWWANYGDECPELQHLAIRVLSLTCSATGCERNWSTFDHIHSKKRNRLEQQRLNALVFVKYNINLDTRLQKRKDRGETYDPICLSDMESDDEWITEKEDACLPGDVSWMDIHECFNENEGTSSNKRKRGPRNLNKVRVNKESGKRPIVDVEDDDEDEVEADDEDVVELYETTVLDEDDEHFDPDA